MKSTLLAASLSAVVAVVAAVALNASPALSRDDAVAIDVAAEAAAPAAYQAHLAANDAAAERWRAAHGTGRPDTPPEEPAPDTHGCPQGTQYWQRDRITELCAPVCTGDQDCGPEDGRCRLLDVEAGDDAAAIVLVDDTPAEELLAVELDETRQAPPIRVCDPFFDIEGATDADVVAVAE
jgi:hypothetical protein